MARKSPDTLQTQRSLPAQITLGLAIIAITAFFTALGIWQLERRVWKLNLIQLVDRNSHASPVAAPGPAEWPTLTPNDAYRHVTIHGTFLNDLETPVQAVTDHGAGYWIVTPLKSDDGFVVLINRGFVPPDKKDPATRPTGQIVGETDITGLLRLTEPHGRFLRANDPATNHWYSRDVTAIAASKGLPNTAPYFVDADDKPNVGSFPIGGLTAIAFPNNHLIYAMTWFGLALLSIVFGFRVLKPLCWLEKI